jgi:YidC/Oxa1 family membrane protein insertase
MDRKAWIVVILCIAALGLWQWAYVEYYAPNPSERTVPAASAATEPQPTPSPSQPVPTEVPQTTVPTPIVVQAPREKRAITTKLADFHFVSGAGGLEKIVLFDHVGEKGGNVTLNLPEALPVGALSESPGVAVEGFSLQANVQENSVAMVRRLEDGVDVKKTFTVNESPDGQGNYTVVMALEFANPGSTAVQRPDFYVSTGGAAPVHATDMTIYTGFDWYRDGKAHFTDVNWFESSSIPLTGIQLRDAQNFYTEKAEGISWAAVKNQYFVNIVAVNEGEAASTVWARRLTRPHPGEETTEVFGIEGALGFPGFRLEPGAVKIWSLQIYTGPKDLERLSQLGHGEQEVMNFGIFKWVSEILLYSMNALYGWLGNFAAAIIALTIIIKALLWPLQNKATDSMRRMAALSPKMTELREKYKDDPTKMNQELMKLYKDYGVNPFSGCLPMLIQIPIFFGFYSMLGTAIELRNSSFLWVNDLSQPDTVAHVLGFPINILPLLMAATMFWQMAITPNTGDAMQRRIFMFMPLIFILFAYNFASALSLYWTTQNLISILQLYLTRNKPLPMLEKKSVEVKKALEAGKGKKRKSRP